MQEGTVADSSQTILYCGQKALPWACFTETVDLRARMSTAYSPNEKVLDNLNSFRFRKERGIFIYLLQVLHLMRTSECEDPRDKVYAALGLAMDVYSGDIVPDYTKTVRHVYTDFIRHCISSRCEVTSCPLDFLGEASYPACTGLPAWVPCWTERSVSRRFTSSRLSHKDKPLYAASGSLGFQYNMRDRRLQLSGAVIDRVSHMEDVRWSTKSREELLATAKSWIPSDNEAPYFTGTGETGFQAFRRTLVRDLGLIKSGGNWY